MDDKNRTNRTKDLVNNIINQRRIISNTVEEAYDRGYRDAYDKGYHDASEKYSNNDECSNNSEDQELGVWIYERWITHNLDQPFWSIATCSKCNSEVSSIFDHYSYFPHCPKCGHKMDTTGYYHKDKYVNTAAYSTVVFYDKEK